MIIVGLTGSIGMGKSETAKMFRRLDIPVYDADAAVHALYAPGGAAVAPIAEAFPGVVTAGGVDRQALGARVLNDRAALARLEAIVHPLVGQAQAAFLDQAQAEGRDIVVLDVPLLFETGGSARVDVTVVVSAPPEVQRDRVLARPGMTADKFEAILAKQVPDADKRARADFIIDTSRGLDPAFDQVKVVIDRLRAQAAPDETARG